MQRRSHTIATLALATGLKKQVIHQILYPAIRTTRVKTNTALVIAKALDMKVEDVFGNDELTQRGRTPLTKNETGKGRRQALKCPTCHMTIPIRHGKNCPDCSP